MNSLNYTKNRLMRFLAVALLLVAASLPVCAANLVQEFYLPLPEQQLYTALNTIRPAAAISTAQSSIYTIVVTGDGTVVYYDNWEDGYEIDLSHPTSTNTYVWGDGIDTNGICPGFVHDPVGLPTGTVITLTNTVTLPRNPSQILYDARDRIGATKALTITHAGWPVTPGPVFGEAVSVLSTIDYGTNYVSPVGTNMANLLFKYVGMSVMAAQNNTTVTIDPNGNGVGTTTIVLNQGESYQVNNGIKQGGRITSTKPVQAHLIIGDTGNSYASDWFTLYPVESWDNAYYTPVGSAKSGSYPAYVYLYNSNTNALTINYATQAGSGSFSIPATNGVYQFQMPIGSGASFVSASGQNFFAICTVAAPNSSADTAFNWGFTLVPKGALTTEAAAGWAPGSADGTVNGSPIWVTALANTTIYVDYKGDRAGPLTDPNGKKYDTNYIVSALQTLKIFDPSKNQTAMRVYTVDGTLISAAWGEDPDTASPGNPYIDAGTTVIPFPTPTLTKIATIVTDTVPTGLSIGDTILYSVQVDNKGLLPLGNTVVIDTPTTNLTYVTNSTFLNGVAIADNPPPYTNGVITAFPLDNLGSAGYTIPIILSQGTSTFTYKVTVNAAGSVSNSVNIGGTTIISQTTIFPPSTTNTPVVYINFSDTNGVATNSYLLGANVFVTMTNAIGNTVSNTLQSINVTVTDTNTGDAQTITLLETSTNSGVFRNVAGLPTSNTTGQIAQDGTLYVAAGDTLRVSYTDPVYGDSATNFAIMTIPTPFKQLYLTANGVNGVQQLNRVNPVATAGHGTTYTSVDIGGSSSGVVTLDSVTTVSNTAITATLPHVTSAGANRLMLVGVSMNRATAATLEMVTNVTYAGQSLTLVGSRTNTASGEAVMWMYALTNPPAGSNNVVVSFDKADVDGEVIGCATFTGVNQSTPYGAFFSNTGTSTSVSLAVTSATNELVFDTVILRSSDFGASGSPGANQSALWKTYYNARVGAGASTQAGAASVTETWTSAASVDWAIGAVSIKPVAVVLPATNSTAFAQTPNFALPFTMPAGGVVSITNFITVTNGAANLAASPGLITATLRTNGVNFLTLSNTTYTAGVGNTNLVWSGILPSSITVAAGTNLTYVISNNVANSAFHVNYDSTNQPSQIVLPASTVIAISPGFGVYDAPFPNGNLVTTPIAGTTLYVRATVTDPFGTNDISSVVYSFTAPNTNNNFSFTNTLANIVTNTAGSRTFEYVWATGPATGNYTVVATANEGTEGVSATATASLTTIFLDLGTPSTTEFTGGNNGASTNSYLANSNVCVRVTDLNRNTNASTVQSINATITSVASGVTNDIEGLVLVETGTNTGIFTACINATTNTAIPIGNGTNLVAPVGSILTVNYTDPTDTSDSTFATATVQPVPGTPGISMTKTIVSPTGGQVGVGVSVVYNLQVVNVGSTVLTNVAITDTFSSNRLNYVSASVTPTTILGGTLTWTGFGNFTPGQSTNITVTFTSSATGAATNSATVNSASATNTSTVTIAVNSAAIQVTKILLSPTNQPVAVGTNVVFRITFKNVGNTTINYLPFEDNFSGAYYQYVSATIPANGSGFGSLIWTNIASPVTLATNAIITNDVTMKVVGQGNPANNTALVDFATDIFGNPVPITTGSTNVVTAAAAINGFVYNDATTNHSGIYNTNDTGLANVTLQLFTADTNGNPVTLVQQVTSGGNGYYELLNLNLGAYVVVETDLPGYASSAPANNRFSLNITNLTAVTNINFFDYIPALTNYSTFSGKVFNDTNGFGTNTSQLGVSAITVDVVQDLNSNGIVDLGEPVVSSTTTDTNGNYSLGGITPGRYVIRETDAFGYYSTGDSKGANDNQISIVASNGVAFANNYFFDRLSPTAVDDTVSAYYFAPTNIFPLTNDLSPNGDALAITNAVSTNGIVSIGIGSTNLIFTPTNLGTAYITYTLADAHGGTSTATITVTVTALADLALGKTASPSPVLATSNLVYTISVTNFGPSIASSVTVTDAVPAGATFVSASGGGTNNAGLVTWNLGTLTNGAISNLTLTVAAPANGSLTNVAIVGSPTGDPIPGNNTNPPVITSITPVTDLALGKTASPSPVLATSNLVYTISVTNFGPSTASSVVVTDAIPFGATFVSASGGGVTNAGIASWNIGTLLSNQVTNVTMTVKAPVSGSLTNVASVGPLTGDPIPGNNTNPPVTTSITPVADVALGKTGPANVTYGTNFSYVISVTNFGPSIAASLAVTDSLPAGLSFVSAVPAAITNAGNQVIWTNLGNFASGATSNLTLTVNPTSAGTVSNVASVWSPTGDPTPGNNTNPPAVTTIAKAPLTVTVNSTNRVYGAANPVFTGTLTGVTNGDNITVTYGTVAVAGSPVGSYAIVPTIIDPNGRLANYNVTTNLGTLIINPASLVITANSTNKVYNTVLNLGTNAYASVGLVNGDAVTGVSLASLGTAAPAAVGTYAITATNAVGAGLTNYAISYVSGVLTVTRGVYTATWTNPPSIVYGTPVGTNQNNAFESIGGTNSYNPTNGVVLPAGTNTLTVVFTPGDTNYAATNLSVQLVVTPAPLVITANSTNKVYNTVLNLGTNAYASVGLVNGDAVTGVTLASLGTAAPAAVGTYAITATNAVGGSFNPNNYSITYSDGLLTVNPLPVIMYGVRGTDGTTNAPASILQVTNKAGGDVVIIASGVGGISSSNVGVWPITSFGTLALGGAAATNYTLAGASGWVSVTNTALVTNRADIVVSVSGPSAVTVGDAFFYTVVVSNSGPTAAVNTLVTNVLPTNLVFSAASAGGVLTNKNTVKWPVIPTLANGQVTNFTVTVYSTNGITTNVATANPYNFIQTNLAPAIGLLTNRAFAFATTFDPNLTNNSASTFYTNAQVNTLIVPGVLSVFVATNTYPTNVVFTNAVTPIGPNLFIVGTNADNPQTGLHEENVTVTNIGTVPIHSIRLYVGGLRSGVTLYNATGTNNGVAYVEYDAPYNAPINPYPAANNHVTFQLEFYVTDWRPFTNSLSAVATLASTNGTISGTAGAIQKITDSRFVNDRFIIQLSSIPGRTYTVEYKDDLLSPTWKIAIPSIVASANVTQWYDDGPPKTDSLPSSVTNRFYQVIKNN